MKKKQSIQETLMEIGFIINGDNFVCNEIVIPASELSKHTVDSFFGPNYESFRERAAKRGWVRDQPANEIPMLLQPGCLMAVGTLTARGNAIEASRKQLGTGVPYQNCIVIRDGAGIQIYTGLSEEDRVLYAANGLEVEQPKAPPEDEKTWEDFAV